MTGQALPTITEPDLNFGDYRKQHARELASLRARVERIRKGDPAKRERWLPVLTET